MKRKRSELDIAKAHKVRKYLRGIKKYLETFHLDDYLQDPSDVEKQNFHTVLSKLCELPIMNEKVDKVQNPYVFCMFRAPHLRVFGYFRLSMWLAMILDNCVWYFNNRKGEHTQVLIQNIQYKIVSYKNIKFTHRNLLNDHKPVTNNCAYENLEIYIRTKLETYEPISPEEFKISKRDAEVLKWGLTIPVGKIIFKKFDPFLFKSLC